MTLGYFVPTEEDIIKVKFLKQFEGYLWSFPRADHLSVGICAKMGQNSSQQLRRHLDDFVAEEKIPMEGARFYSHVLPSPQAKTIRGRRIAGGNWAMAGDAAACVDPITGEGLYYALRSGDLLAQALIEGSPQAYPERLRAAFSADLEFAANIARKLFRGTFLGGAITTRMVQLLNHSPAFRDLIRDVFSGSQDYRSLKRRLWNQLGITVAEFTRSFLDPRGMRDCGRPERARAFAMKRAKMRRKIAKKTPSSVAGLPRIGLEASYRKSSAARMDAQLLRPASSRCPLDSRDDRDDGSRRRKRVVPELPPGAITVGTRIEVDHLKAVTEGATVLASARLVEYRGRFLVFDVEARSGAHLLGRGRVFRAIVEHAGFHAKADSHKAKSTT